MLRRSHTRHIFLIQVRASPIIAAYVVNVMFYVNAGNIICNRFCWFIFYSETLFSSGKQGMIPCWQVADNPFRVDDKI